MCLYCVQSDHYPFFPLHSSYLNNRSQTDRCRPSHIAQLVHRLTSRQVNVWMRGEDCHYNNRQGRRYYAWRDASQEYVCREVNLVIELWSGSYQAQFLSSVKIYLCRPPFPPPGGGEWPEGPKFHDCTPVCQS